MEQPEPRAASLTEEERYRVLVDAITDYAIFMLDETGRVSSWNAGARRFKGYEAHEIIGRHFSTFYTPEDRAAGVPERALRTAATEGRFEAEGERVRKDGTRFWAHVIIDPIFAADGALIGFSKVTRDLTERRQQELDLRRSQEQFRRLVEGVTDYAIYMLDLDGRVTSWNIGAERIKGYTRDEILGQHFSRFYTEPDAAAGLPARALQEARTKGRFESEGWRVRKDGTRFWANVVVDAIRDEAGALIGYAKITRDVTEKRAAQLELDAAREALFQSQKMDAIGQLTGGVAHDFNNLLAVIIGSLGIVRKRMAPDPKVDPLIDNAISAAERGAALTKRMLAFARKQELQTRAVDLAELTAGLTELLARSLGPGVVIETDFPPGLDKVEADANQIELALLNLAVNARDAMPDGGSLRIGAHAEQVAANHPTGLSPGRYVCLSVIDTGQGMDEETLKHAAEPFFTTKGIGRGTGLGLSMVHGLSEQLGGRFMLRSVKGQGTTAEIWLPVAETEAPARAEPSRPTAAQGRKMTVLAVDDDALVLMNTSTMLEELGHEVIEANSGRRALEMLRDHPGIDLVVTDQAMPGMTGSQLATAIHANWPTLPVILATGYSELPPDGDASLPRLSKPFGERELADKIRAATP